MAAFRYRNAIILFNHHRLNKAENTFQDKLRMKLNFLFCLAY